MTTAKKKGLKMHDPDLQDVVLPFKKWMDQEEGKGSAWPDIYQHKGSDAALSYHCRVVWGEASQSELV